MKDRKIRIISKAKNELSSSVQFGGEKFIVQTERGGTDFLIVTQVFLKGKIVSTTKTNHSYLAGSGDAEKKIQELMQRQHQSAADALQKSPGTESAKPVSAAATVRAGYKKMPADYIEDAKKLLLKKDQDGAVELLEKALTEHPGDPFLMSYLGCLDVIVNKKYKSGIDLCRRAIALLKDKVPFGEEFFYPVLYLNLGRAYIASGKRKDAIDAFRRGLKTYPDNPEILAELQRLGSRKKPPVPFLSRSNPINKYIGMLLRSGKK